MLTADLRAASAAAGTRNAPAEFRSRVEERTRGCTNSCSPTNVDSKSLAVNGRGDADGVEGTRTALTLTESCAIVADALGNVSTSDADAAALNKEALELALSDEEKAAAAIESLNPSNDSTAKTSRGARLR